MPAPTIVVIDPSHVTIDGASVGSVTDILANHDPGVTLTPGADGGGFRSALLAALIARDAAIAGAHAEALAARDAAHAEAARAAAAGHDAAAAAQAAAHAEALAARDDELARQRAATADLQTLVDALGGTGLGRKLARDRRRQALLRQQADVAARLAAIDRGEDGGGDVPVEHAGANP
jgi:hypothetical protein